MARNRRQNWRRVLNLGYKKMFLRETIGSMVMAIVYFIGIFVFSLLFKQKFNFHDTVIDSLIFTIIMTVMSIVINRYFYSDRK